MASLCVFCGSSFGSDPGLPPRRRISAAASPRRGHRLVYGGGSVGLMGVGRARARRAGGEVIGVIPDFLRYAEIPEDEVTKMHFVGSMHERKQTMFDLSDALPGAAGGIGTIDESIEIMTWAQLGRHAKPSCSSTPTGYWSPFMGLLRDIVAKGFAKGALASSTVWWAMPRRAQQVSGTVIGAPAAHASSETTNRAAQMKAKLMRRISSKGSL
jgi:uncharacterized protein (TIGR00730 family)